MDAMMAGNGVERTAAHRRPGLLAKVCAAVAEDVGERLGVAVWRGPARVKGEPVWWAMRCRGGTSEGRLGPWCFVVPFGVPWAPHEDGEVPEWARPGDAA